MEQYMWAVWLGVFVLSLIIEGLTCDLISIWFAGGSLLTLFLSFIPGLPRYGEIIIFIAISIILLIATKPLVKKFLNSKNDSKTNVDRYVGKEFILLKDIDQFNKGEIKIDGVVWDCISENNEKIEKGKVVIVKSIKGNRFIVKEVEKDD